jgi:hypothetical protein
MSSNRGTPPEPPPGSPRSPGSPGIERPRAEIPQRADFVWPPPLPPAARLNRRRASASQVFLDYERELKARKPLKRVDATGAPLIKIVLKSKPDAAASVAGSALVGDASSSGGDKEGKPEEGFMLQSFSKSIWLWLSTATMMKCPFFKKMLGSAWADQEKVELQLMSPDLVDAFESVLHVLQIEDYSIHEDINEANQFKIYNAANFLGFHSIQQQCEAFIKQNMDEQVCGLCVCVCVCLSVCVCGWGLCDQSCNSYTPTREFSRMTWERCTVLRVLLDVCFVLPSLPCGFTRVRACVRAYVRMCYVWRPFSLPPSLVAPLLPATSRCSWRP